MAAVPSLAELCAPVDWCNVAALLQRAGFDPAAYLEPHADLRQNLSGAAIEHFMRYGFAERRRFAITLDPEPLAELQALPIRNRSFVTHLLAAVSEAFVAAAGGDLADWLDVHAAVIERLSGLGAVPFVLVGDSTTSAYAVSSVRDGQWLLAIASSHPGISARALGTPASVRAEPARQLIRRLAAAQSGLPLLLKFGPVDAVFTHKIRRLEHGPSAFDAAEFDAFSREAIGRYLGFLDAVVARPRNRVTVVGLVPSAVPATMWQALLEFHGAPVRNRLGAAEFAARLQGLEILPGIAAQRDLRRFNAVLQRGARSLGFGYLDHLDALLDAYGRPAEALPGEHHLDLARVHPVVAGSLWNLLARGGPEAEGERG